MVGVLKGELLFIIVFSGDLKLGVACFKSYIPGPPFPLLGVGVVLETF